MKIHQSIFILLLFGISACQAKDNSISEIEQNSHYVISYSPSVSPIRPVIDTCAQYEIDGDFFIVESYNQENESDLHIQFGEPSPLPDLVAQIAFDELVVILNISNPQPMLDLLRTQEIYRGEKKSWGENENINLWVLPPFDDTQKAFEENVIEQSQIDGSAYISPSLPVMLSSIQSDHDAIGFVPAAWLNEKVISYSLGIEVPILVSANQPPDNSLLDFVSCLQSPEIQDLINLRYQSILP